MNIFEDITDMIGEYQREHGTLPTRIDMSVQSFTRMRQHPDCNLYFQRLTEASPAKVMGLELTKTNHPKQYIKVH